MKIQFKTIYFKEKKITKEQKFDQAILEAAP